MLGPSAELSIEIDGLSFTTTVASELRDQACALLVTCAGLRNSDKGLQDGHVVQFGGPSFVARREGNGWSVREPEYLADDPVGQARADVTPRC
jgi:hypothetical protein